MSTPLLRISGLKVAVEGIVLKESVSFVAEPGKAVRITGRNGTGKTTLIKTILGIQPRSTGEVHFGIPMVLGDSVSYFPQAWGDSLLPWMNAWENILVGTLNSSSSSLGKLIGKLCCQFFPELTTQICFDNTSSHEILASIRKRLSVQNVTKLSGGQQEKIVILRTVICNPSLLFLDEPYRDLDYESTKDVNDYFQHFIEQGNSVVYVSHQDVGIKPDIIVSMD